MSLIDNLRESILRFRVIPKQTPEDTTSFRKAGETINDDLDKAEEAGKRIDLTDLLNISSLKGDRNKKYEVFEEMVADGRIGAAIEMYANDTVQYNSEGKIVWIEAKDQDVEKYCTKLLEDLGVADNIWSWAYCLWLYGDVYLETFENTSNDNSRPTLLLEPNKYGSNVHTQIDIEGANLERYIEKVPNPAEVYDLQFKGKTSGYARAKTPLEGTLNNNIYHYDSYVDNIQLLNPTKFIHICLSPNINRYPEKFNLIQETDPERLLDNGTMDGSAYEGSSGNLSYSVKTGQSVLENVYSAYQALKLKEDSVLLERVTKSAIIRVVQVELGDLPESQKKKKLRELKNQIEQQIQLNKEAGTMQSRAGAQPNENIIYTTTKQGKGAISTVNIGGDGDIGNTDDITDSENKVYGSLLVPKALLGADMEGSGLSNGGSLTEMNTTYARRIKRGQVALCTGIKDLINIFALSDGNMSVINNFTVKLTPIITVEDNRRDELLENKLNNVDKLYAVIEKIENLPEKAKIETLLHWLSKYLNQQEIVTIVKKALDELEREENADSRDEQLEEMGADEEYDNRDIDINVNTHSEPPPTNNEEDNNFGEEMPEDLETAPQEDIAEIEGEDLL